MGAFLSDACGESYRTPISHRTGWPEHCVWKLCTLKTLLERAGLRTGAPSMGAFFFGAWVSGTPGEIGRMPAHVGEIDGWQSQSHSAAILQPMLRIRSGANGHCLSPESGNFAKA